MRAWAWLRAYRRAWLPKDLLAGLTAGAVVIPQAMAYATIADLPTQVGLYTCMVPMVVYALCGGSRAMSVSTTSTIAVLTGSTLLAAGVAAGADDPARSLATLTLLVGLILFLARLLRLGSLIDNISDATLTGIKVGVGLTVAAGQLPGLLGFSGDPSADNFVAEMRAVIDHFDQVSWTTAALSAGTIGMMLLLRRVAPAVPGPLVAVIGGILLVSLASIDEHGVALIAPIPSGLPTPVVPTLDNVDGLIAGALAIAIMAFLETLAVARAVRRPDEPPIDNDQEMLASGLACGIGALFRAMPSAGGFSQTAINQRAGARTQLSELVTVSLAVCCALFLGGVLSKLPQATLAAMVVVAVVGLIEPARFVEFWRLSRIEFWVAALTAVAGLLLGLLAAVLVGVVLTLFLVIVELDRIGVTELRPTATGDDVVVAAASAARPVDGLLVLRLDGPLYTANVRSVNRTILSVLDARGDVRVLVIDCTAINHLPVTVINVFADLRRELEQRGVELWLAALRQDAMRTAEQTAGWVALDTERRVHPTALAALRAYVAADRQAGSADG